jgi:predicted ABC-type ATPase
MKKMKKRSQSTVYVIAGPNGAGKTTFASEFLLHYAECREFVNADLIAAGLSPFDPEGQAVRAGRLVLSRIKELSQAKRDFAFETTLAGKTYKRILLDMKEENYRVVVFFLWIPDPEIAIERVATRVRQGGHDIPVQVIRRRFVAGLKNLRGTYRSVWDTLQVLDASSLPPKLIAHQSSRRVTVVHPGLYEKYLKKCEGYEL